jgi:hypothetical protein
MTVLVFIDKTKQEIDSSQKRGYIRAAISFVMLIQASYYPQRVYRCLVKNGCNWYGILLPICP